MLATKLFAFHSLITILMLLALLFTAPDFLANTLAMLAAILLVILWLMTACIWLEFRSLYKYA
jgi:hypothetical protein